MQFIDTFELRFPGLSHAEVAAQHPSPWRDVTLPRQLNGQPAVAETPQVQAFVDGSRWLARCPNPVCGGAERVNFETGLFFCCGCRNAPWEHAYLRVDFPPAKARAQIEAALLKRADWRVRAWRPDETVADLERQNRERGVK